jgi:hypothetical protein
MPAAGHSLAVGFSSTAGRSGNISDFEPGVITEETYVHLTDHAGGPEDSNRYLAHENSVPEKNALCKRLQNTGPKHQAVARNAA